MNLHGNFLVANASLTKKEEAMVEEQESPEASMDTDQAKVKPQTIIIQSFVIYSIDLMLQIQ